MGRVLNLSAAQSSTDILRHSQQKLVVDIFLENAYYWPYGRVAYWYRFVSYGVTHSFFSARRTIKEADHF